MSIEINIILAKAAVLLLMLSPIVGALWPGWFGLTRNLEGRLTSALAALFICVSSGCTLVVMTLGVKFLLS